MPKDEAPIGNMIQGTTTAPGPAGIAGKSVALNLAKRAYFRFQDREDFELTKAAPSARLPKDISTAQARAILMLIQKGDLVRGTKAKIITKKKLDRVKPYMLFIAQSSDFNAIKRRIQEVAAMGGNVAQSGYGAREVVEMMIEQELETHARNDVLNLMDRVLRGLPGANLPHDEPGSHAIGGTQAGGSAAFAAQDIPEPAKPGSRSAREAIGRKVNAKDLASL